MIRTHLVSSTRRGAAACLGTLLVLSGLVAIPPTTAAAAALPCAAGTPVPGDYNGDGAAEALISQDTLIGTRAWSVSAGGSPTAKAFILATGYNKEFRNADLNGDVCSDVLVTVRENPSDSVRLILGTRSGLDAGGAATLALPQTGQHPDQALSLDPAIGLRHHGISQVAVTVSLRWPATDPQHFATFLDVFTLDPSGKSGTAQVIEPADVGSGEFGPVDGSGSSLVVGAPGDTVAGRDGAGAVLMFTADSTDPRQMAFRTRITEDSPGVPDSAEAGDHFGAALSFRDGWLAIGVPSETINKARDTGQVQPIHWDENALTYTAYRAINQNTSGVPGRNQSGESFGRNVLVTKGLTAAGSHDIVIAWQDSDTDRVNPPGHVVVANATRAIFRGYTQRNPGESRLAYSFGHTLGLIAASTAVDTLLIGSPSENFEDCENSGRVVSSAGRRLTSTTTLRDVPSPGCDNQSWGLTISR